MIQAIFFDIDGTLRAFTEKGIRPSVYEAIAKARAAQIRCFIATGRHPMEIEEDHLLGDLQFDGYVYLNGCYCVDGDGQVVFSAPIPRSQAEIALKLTQEEPFELLAMEADRFYVNRATPYVVHMHKLLGTRPPKANSHMEDCLVHPIYQLVIYGETPVLDRVVAQLPLCSATRWNQNGALDIVPTGVDKCTGIAAMLKRFHLTPRDAAAVGDGFNDIGMLEMVKLGVCMGNGTDETRKIADYIAPNIDDDGLLKAVEYIIEHQNR